MTDVPRITFDGTATMLPSDGVFAHGPSFSVWRYGREIGIWYGDVTKISVGVGVTDILLVEIVDDGTLIVQRTIANVSRGLGMTMMYSFWIDAYPAGPAVDSGLLSTPLAEYVQAQIDAAGLSAEQLAELATFKDWGHWEVEFADFGGDNKFPQEAASPRVSAHFVPAAVALVLGADNSDIRWFGQQWTFSQGIRGANVVWRPIDNPDWRVGQGYGNAYGGFSDILSGTMPPGMAGWPGVGWPVPLAQHMCIDAQVWFALAYRSFAAAQTAVGQFLSNAGHVLLDTEWFGSRAHGWSFRSMAYMAPLLDDGEIAGWVSHVNKPDVMFYCEQAVTNLEGHNWLGMPTDDTGAGSGESYHLNNGHCRDMWEEHYGLTFAEAPGSDVTELVPYARSCNSWMTGVLIEGLINVVDLWDAYGWWGNCHPLRKRILVQLKYAADYLIEQAGATAFDVTYRFPRIPLYGIWEDTAIAASIASPSGTAAPPVPSGPGIQLGKNGDSSSLAKGVNSRFLVGPVYALIRLVYPNDTVRSDALKEFCRLTMNECNTGTWGGKNHYEDWIAEAGMEFLAGGGIAGPGTPPA